MYGPLPYLQHTYNITIYSTIHFRSDFSPRPKLTTNCAGEASYCASTLERDSVLSDAFVGGRLSFCERFGVDDVVPELCCMLCVDLYMSLCFRRDFSPRPKLSANFAGSKLLYK